MANACASADLGISAKLRVAVLVSGRGSNLAALIEARRADGPFELVGVFSDRADAPALDRAREAGIPAFHVARCDHESELGFQRAFFKQVAAASPDLIVCAGFMRVIRRRFVDAIAPMINIHPSLLPRHRGLHTHQAVLNAREPEHGASVHRVTPELDAGPVIAQVGMEVRADDDAGSLSRRLLPLEHLLLVACVRALACGDLLLPGAAGVLWRGLPLIQPLRPDPSTGNLEPAAGDPGHSSE